jgi:integrase
MPSDRISDAGVRKLKPRSGTFIEFDTVVKGFGVRVTPAGTKAFVIDYRTRSGRQRRYTIGAFPTWTVIAARDHAKKLLQKVNLGGDPVADRKANRGGETVADLAERYIEQHLPKKRPRSQREDRDLLRLYILPAMRTMKVREVDHAAVDALHRKITKAGKPTRANAVVRLLSKLFNLSIKWSMRADNPTKHVEKNEEQPRERYLSQAEIKRLWAALDAEQDRESVAAILLAMLTGARLSEIVKATWDQFNLEQGVWTKPSAHTKQKRIHRAPLTPRALAMLQALRQENPRETMLFPVRAKIGTVRPAWERVRAAAKLEDVRFHDLRHSFASLLAGDGVSLLMIGKLLGHTQQKTTARYAHVDDQPLRDALKVIDGKLGGGSGL